jgi:hypothetical protein
MLVAARQARTLVTAQSEFEALKPLPCGCVAAIHRTLDPGLSVVSLEAKGPYCSLPEHLIGRVAAVPTMVASGISLPELDED